MTFSFQNEFKIEHFNLYIGVSSIAEVFPFFTTWHKMAKLARQVKGTLMYKNYT